MKIGNVKKLYALGNAKWYDYFKGIWDKLTASKAEMEFRRFFRNNVDETSAILELGCGTALNLEKIFSLNLKFKNYLGLDFSSEMLGIAMDKFGDTPNVEFQQKDITKFDQAINQFDIILCTWVLSHLQAPSDFVNRAQELLASHGKMFLVFYTKPRWFINIWLYPLSRFLFASKPLPDREVALFKNVRTKHQFSAGITTTILIHK